MRETFNNKLIFIQENAYRIDKSESKGLPTIIAQVIGYNHAKQIFKMVEGNTEVDSDEWKGKLDGVKYTFGGPLDNNQLIKLLIIIVELVFFIYF
jgi:hypothetical protein